MNPNDLQALWLSVRLATLSTLVLMVIGPLCAICIEKTKTPFRPLLEATVALPLVLPPTVLGFYLLVLLSPDNPLGGFLASINGESLTFNFSGLLFASVIYSLPFVVQPMQSAFAAIDKRYMDIAATMGMKPLERFFRILLPMTKPALISAALLAFVHTLGEFGVVLMIGGNIPGETRVVSIALFDHVETLDFESAHRLSLILLCFSLSVLTMVYGWLKPKHVIPA
ncbi:molybdate ABC transporter permease subunit [Echinimonas agarilytica]|uniref:Molybdenum transport system permease n=1 Tax=Echinimonas agarilytica TaxID=1215918 RepID=A0AA41W8L8_9GAMM|nr:molybdate ABC transporter permease subunit [Echinimonas agarilytica]MCM2680462.1 molybdate ABC transporter permease subunit [Echinimonas agarilytica]